MQRSINVSLTPWLWVSDTEFATTDEGDLDGGSRGFTLFEQHGGVLFNSENSVEHLVTRLGHYPEDRSENNRNEPEGVEFGEYGGDKFLFVGSERSNVIAVYRVNDKAKPELVQVLPAGVGPEGLLAIPKRNLFVVASEVDDRGAKIRSSITIYQLVEGEPTYPTLQSADRKDGSPIPWSALSALAADPEDPDRAFTAYDSFYRESRSFQVDVSDFPAIITDEIVLRDGGDTVDLDVEGLSVRSDGGFWIVSEGAGSVDDSTRPVTSLNELYKVTHDGPSSRKLICQTRSTLYNAASASRG